MSIQSGQPINKRRQSGRIQYRSRSLGNDRGQNTPWSMLMWERCSSRTWWTTWPFRVRRTRTRRVRIIRVIGIVLKSFMLPRGMASTLEALAQGCQVRAHTTCRSSRSRTIGGRSIATCGWRRGRSRNSLGKACRRWIFGRRWIVSAWLSREDRGVSMLAMLAFFDFVRQWIACSFSHIRFIVMTGLLQ